MTPSRVFGISNYAPWWGKRLPPDLLTRVDAPGIAGGETMMLEQCFALAGAGYQVDLFSDTFEPGEHRGVTFHVRDEYERAVLYDGEAPDVAIAWQTPYGLHVLDESVPRILVQQCNDLNYPAGWTRWVDALVAASANHAMFLRALGYDGPLEVVHNGCHLERYTPAPLAPQRRDPIVAYWSSPDRGLHHLLAAWPHVRKARPDAILRVHYEIERIFEHARKGVDGMRQAAPQALMRIEVLRDQVVKARSLPGVIFTGMLSRSRLIAAQCETRVMCYPLDPYAYTEGMGSSVSEAMAAGALPLIRPVDAFPSVYGGAVRWIEGDPTSSAFPEVLAAQIVEALNWTGLAGETPLLADLRTLAQRWSWANARKETVRVVERVLARKRSEPVPEPFYPLEDPLWKGAA